MKIVKDLTIGTKVPSCAGIENGRERLMEALH